MDLKSQDKRPIKRVSKRKPKDSLFIDELTREVQKRTGFRHQDIKEVFIACIEVLIDEMCKKKKFTIPRLGVLYPTIKRGREVTSLNGGCEAPTRKWMDSRWVLRLQPGTYVTERLLKVKVTPKEEEEMYYGND